MSVLGNRVLRKEDPRFLRGEGRYVENLPLEGAASVTFVRSLLAHANIAGVGTAAAEALPGVQVLTGADVDVGPFGPPPFPGLEQGMGRPLVAVDTVRFVGEIVAIVISEDRAAGVDAAELVSVEYEPLPVVVSPQDAAKDEVLLFPEAGTNVAARSGSPEHDEKLFDGCDVVVSGTLVSQRMAPCPLEPRSAPPSSVRTAGSRPGSRRRRRTRTVWCSRGRSGSIRRRFAWSPPTSAAASAPRCSASRRSCSPGSRAGSAGPCAGRRRAARAWSRFRTAAHSAWTSPSAGRGTARCSPTGSTSCRTPARTRRSAPSCRT